MENLRSILQKIQDTVAELDLILAEEVGQLRRPQINPILLQIISDSKSRLLSTISYYDDLRRQEESRLKTIAPYPQHDNLASLWLQVTSKVKKANELNQEIYGLLDMHLQKTNSLKSMVNKVGANLSLYGSNGQSSTTHSGKVYNITI